MSWKTYYGPNQFDAMVYKYEIKDATTIDDLKKACGDTAEEKLGRVKWAHPDCMIVKTLEVVFEPKTGRILEWKKQTWDDRVATMIRK